MWHVLLYKGSRYKSIDEMAIDLVNKTKDVNLFKLLRNYKVTKILLGKENRAGLAWLTCENPFIKNLAYRITLDPNRTISDWIEDLSHELAHLIAHQDFDSVSILKGEEIFAETFCKLWAQEVSNRTRAKKLFNKLIKEKIILL